MYKKLIAITLLFVMIFSGCATSPNKIPTAYVSPLGYSNYDCDQIAQEMEHIGRRTNELYYKLKKEADKDKWQMGIGMLVFWPALLFLEGGDGPEAQEYSRLKGEYEALRQTAIQKKCNVEQLPPSPDEIVKDLEKQRKKRKK